jgi:ABC-type Fe3+ transport system substrate-binding protein
MVNLKRRRALGFAAATAAAAYVGNAPAYQSYSSGGGDPRSLDELYREALAERGRLVVYAGGDLATAQVATENAFRQRFPGVEIRIVTDLSKYHDSRIDQQLARRNLECDVTQLQTLQNFERWKRDGVLLRYKPIGRDAVYPQFKDPDGYFVAMMVLAFSNYVNITQIPEAQAPRDALDYLDPALKGRLALVYPQDDDAVLYQYDRIVSTHGWEYMDRLMTQDVEWRRGTIPTRLHVAAGNKAATFNVSGPLITPAGATSKFLVPRNDSFLSWPQTAAIFAAAKNKAAAKLYLSWLLDKQRIESSPYQWSVRMDVAPPAGWQPLSSYNTDPTAFGRFMKDRARLERLRYQFEHLIGPVVGPNPTGVQGLYVA